MDKKLFEQKLSEVCEWRIPQTLTGTDSGDAKRGRGRPAKEELHQREQEQQFQDEFGGVNPTFPPQLLKLKNASCTCEDCGRYCEHGRQKEKKLYQTGNKPNWRERCVTCGMSRNPFTDQFDVKSSEASFVWSSFLKDRKGTYNTQGNSQRKKQGFAAVIEDDVGRITFYPNTTDPDKYNSEET